MNNKNTVKLSATQYLKFFNTYNTNNISEFNILKHNIDNYIHFNIYLYVVIRV